MGKILLQELGQSKILSLKEHTILGRSPKADILLRLQAIPNLWLEIRYLNGMWLWNVLNGESETVGAGTYIHHTWRLLSKKVRFGNLITLELVDESEPEILIETQHKTFLPLSRFPRIVPLSKNEYQLDSKVLKNAMAFVYDEEIYTLWIPGSAHDTEDTSSIDVQDGSLTIDLDALTATFDFGARKYTVIGEAARSLAVYTLALGTVSPWLTTEEAYLDWINLGGAEVSPAERINWERNKILSKLNKQGSFPLANLFTRRKRGASWEHKLEFTGEIHLLNLPDLDPTD